VTGAVVWALRIAALRTLPAFLAYAFAGHAFAVWAAVHLAQGV